MKPNYWFQGIIACNGTTYLYLVVRAVYVPSPWIWGFSFELALAGGPLANLMGAEAGNALARLGGPSCTFVTAKRRSCRCLSSLDPGVRPNPGVQPRAQLS